jgi:N-acetyl-gamma-glutamyl-phosphate reductase
MTDRLCAGIVGARGFTGAEIIRLLAAHPNIDVTFAGSRELAGQPVPGLDLEFESVGPETIGARTVDIVFLALPDGASDPYLEGIDAGAAVIDISADHRFDDAWVYGLPELFREKISGAKRIANPGCYATAAQLALAPLIDHAGGVPAVFGVSGYSGAGSTPSPRNDPERLADNLIPYRLFGHNHEREATRYLGRPVRFMPHVHPAFSGLIVTAHVPLARSMDLDALVDLFTVAYDAEPLIRIQPEPPELKDGTGIIGVVIGGLAVSDDGMNAVVVVAEDNLLKGAAVQAIQNANLAVGIDELTGIL